MIRRFLERHARTGFFAVLAIQLLLGLQACANLGLEQPKSFRDDYVYAVNQVTAVRDSATQLLERRAISIKDAEYVLNTSREARGYLDTAKSVYEAGDTLKGQSGILLATNVLTQLQTFLNSRSAP